MAGCLFRVVGLCAHALHAHAARRVVTEKGLVGAAGRLPGAPPDGTDFTAVAHGLLAHPGSSAAELTATLDAAEVLLAAVRSAVART